MSIRCWDAAPSTHPKPGYVQIANGPVPAHHERVQNVSFSKGFLAALTLCRLLVYVAFGLLIVLSARDLDRHIIAGLAYFLMLPLLQHKALSVLRRRVLHLGAYVLEWLCTFTVVLLCHPPVGVVLVVVLVFLTSMTALWGWRLLPVIGLSGALVIGVLLLVGVELPIYQNPLVDGLATLVGCAFVLALCAVAHHQASELVQIGASLRSQRQALLRYLPKDVSAHLKAVNSGGVRQVWLTVAFVDLVGFTRATRELPAEALATMLNDFLSSVNAQVEQWDGSVSKFLGDGVLCVFASDQPSARANAAVQAVRCLNLLSHTLQGLNRRWRELGYRQQFAATIGVASGYCCIGDWGSSTRLDYTVIGVPVNVACRLQSEAGARGGLLLDEQTATLVKTAIPLSGEVQITAKGMGLLQAFPVCGDAQT